MRPVLRDIYKSVAKEAGLTLAEMSKNRRLPHIVAARREAWRRAHEAGMSFSDIGRQTGKHHTTVMDGVRAAQEAGW